MNTFDSQSIRKVFWHKIDSLQKSENFIKSGTGLFQNVIRFCYHVVFINIIVCYSSVGIISKTYRHFAIINRNFLDILKSKSILSYLFFSSFESNYLHMILNTYPRTINRVFKQPVIQNNLDLL